jgi:hypothetical protein
MTSADWISFDLHGRVTMGVPRDAESARQLRAMFADFLLEQGGPPYDLTVTDELEELHGVAFAEDDFTYSSEVLTMRSPALQIRRQGRGLRLNGKGELLTTVLPLLDRLMVERGAAMIHAATVRIGGVGVALPAAGGVGKTSTIAKLMKRPDVGFMGDDWAFLTSDKELLGFGKPMFIKPHHKAMYPHLFDGRRKPLVPKRLSRPVHRFTSVVHPFIVRYPKLADVVRRWSPEHKMVAPAKALPHVEMVREAPLGHCIYVERHDGDRPELVEISSADMVSRMLANFHTEMTAHSREVVNLLGASIYPLHELFSEKADLLRKAIDQIPTHLLQVPREWSADRASDAIVAQLETVVPELQRAGAS